MGREAQGLQPDMAVGCCKCSCSTVCDGCEDYFGHCRRASRSSVEQRHCCNDCRARQSAGCCCFGTSAAAAAECLNNAAVAAVTGDKPCCWTAAAPGAGMDQPRQLWTAAKGTQHSQGSIAGSAGCLLHAACLFIELSASCSACGPLHHHPHVCVGSQLPSHAAWPFYHRLWCLLQALLEAFDASHVTSSMLWALIQAWCGDVAAALAAHAADVDSAVQLAANAAAGRWNAVVSTETFSLSTAGCWTCIIDWPHCSGDKLAAGWCSSCARLCTVIVSLCHCVCLSGQQQPAAVTSVLQFCSHRCPAYIEQHFLLIR